MRLLGREIDLADWKGYRGDMQGSEGKTYFDNWAAGSGREVSGTPSFLCLISPHSLSYVPRRPDAQRRGPPAPDRQ